MLKPIVNYVRNSDSKPLQFVWRVALLCIGLVKPILMWSEEIILNIRTRVPAHSAPEPSDRLLFRDNAEYASINYWHMRKMLRVVKPGRDDVVFDLGSGAGRLVCLVARRHVKKCVGVEMSEEYCRIARQNALRLRSRKAPIEIICQDAAQTDLSTGTIYYLFNPFGAETLAAVISNIRASLHDRPRRVQLIYVNPVHEEVLRACGWLNKFHEFDAMMGWRVSFWQNQMRRESP